MINFTRKPHYDYADLLEIIRLLRSEDGCPWDKAQTHKSIRRGLLEEAYEAAEAIDNDDPVLLADFFHELAAHRILPHYLFHIDPIRGVAHFATGMKKGLEIMEYFRKHLSSVATPVFALDLPEGGGKVHLFPDYSAGEEQLFFGLDGKKIRHPLA